MISKEKFVEILQDLQDVNDFVNQTNEKARKLKDAITSDFFNAMSLSISHENIVLELLENMFNDTIMLSWWIYDLDFGRQYKEGCFTDVNDTPIDVSTAEKLYDFLISEMENNKVC